MIHHNLLPIDHEATIDVSDLLLERQTIRDLNHSLKNQIDVNDGYIYSLTSIIERHCIHNYVIERPTGPYQSTEYRCSLCGTYQ